MVERAAGLGFTQEKIAALIGTTKPTLEKHFREELDRGMAVTQFKVGNSLVDNALSGCRCSNLVHQDANGVERDASGRNQKHWV